MPLNTAVRHWGHWHKGNDHQKKEAVDCLINSPCQHLDE